jgi:hypothetical protein
VVSVEQGSIFGAFLALHTPERSGLLAWSALPHAPVLADERAQKRAGRFRRAAARALSGLAERLDPQTGSTAPDGLRAGIGPAY